MNSILDNEVDEEIDERINWDKVRKRNLKINFAKILIKKGNINQKKFLKEELKKTFAFKEYDFKNIANDLFSLSDDVYEIRAEFSEFLSKVYSSNVSVQSCLLDAETDFLREYGVYHDKQKSNSYNFFSYEEYKKIFNRIKELVSIIHWGRLPVFDRHLLFNREIDPEIDTVEFYNHIDCLDALLSEIRSKEGLFLSNDSDKSLNREMSFCVFCRRWGHNDVYNIKRTVEGWFCSNISICGECKKDGSGALFTNLDHDCIFYPKEGVKYAMHKLWEDSDDGKIDFLELKKRLQQVADWISTVEKSINAQPDWVNYY